MAAVHPHRSGDSRSGGAIVFAQQEPASATVTYAAHVWNLAAGNPAWGTDTLATRQGIAAYIAEQEDPLIATYTEICESSWNDLADIWGDLVEDNATTGFKETDHIENACPNSGPRGNAYFAIGTGTGSAFAHHLEPTGNDSEQRYAVCRKVISTGTTWTACAAHFASSPDLAENQAQRAWNWWLDVETTPWVFGGDFNQVWNFDGHPDYGGDANTTAATPLWAYAFAEIHLRSPVVPANLPVTISTGSARKIDYLFARATHFTAGPLITYCNDYYPTYSDHRYCRGRINR